MKVLLLGADGMLGRRLAEVFAPRHEVIRATRSGAEVAVDVTDADRVRDVIRSVAPTVVVNATAWTQVDKAESERAMAYAVNAVAPQTMAAACEAVGAKFVHVSTDFVFDGETDRPYTESCRVRPLSVYGASKEDGERRVRAACRDHLIVRTQWLYGPDGRHFVGTMLRLQAEGKPLRVVADQYGSPTCTVDVALAISRLVDAGVTGTVHAASRGETTWYEFARTLFEFAGVSAALSPITTPEYPTPARRPARSSLRNGVMEVTIGDRMPLWQDALASFLRGSRRNNA